MAFQLSPGVNVSEIDLTTIIPSGATSIGAFAGPFTWGPVGEIITISNEAKLVDRFGKPDSTNYEYWFSAANFLAYSNNLKVVRSFGAATKNAVANGTSILIKNDDDWLDNYSSGANTYGEFAAKYAGTIGNTLKVSMADANTYTGWTYASQFTATPNTSTYTLNQGGANDEIHIIVIDEDGKFTGTANTVLEKFGFVSKALDAKDDSGNTIYYKNVLANKSKYIRWMSHPTANGGATYSNASSTWGNTASLTSFTKLAAAPTISFGGGTAAGADGTTVAANTVTAYNLFSSAESTDISLIITGPVANTISTQLISIAETRKDCIVFFSPNKADVVDNSGSEAAACVTTAAAISSTGSSYAFMDCSWKYQYDKYSDVYRWVPLNGDIAGLCAKTDIEKDPWFSPGGLNRGQIRNVVKLAWNPTKTERDTLYVKGVNPIVTFQGEGTVLFGDKTLLSKPSAFDRINVRRLFIVLEKAIARAARFSMFEFNDQFTRAQFVALVEPYLRDVQGRRGITDFRVVCDDSNNTGEVIDRNEFIGDIYIKPARSINFIQLNFVAVRTGVAFEEVVGKFQ
jgi:phage tail sheath protein FI